jgi:hypothetical protein
LVNKDWKSVILFRVKKEKTNLKIMITIPNVGWLNGACTKIQQRLVDISPILNPNSVRTKLGFLQYLLSPTNTIGQGITFGMDYKYRSVEVVVQRRYTPADITVTANASAQNCLNGGLPNEPFKQNVDISTRYSINKKYTWADLMVMCEDSMSLLTADISRMMDALMVQIDTTLITAKAANFGLFVDGSATKNVNLIITGPPQQFNVVDPQRVRLEMTQAGYDGMVPVVGGNGSWQYFDATKFACCNNLGLNLALSNPQYDYYYDQLWEGIVGSANFMSVIPGTHQLLTWHKYAEMTPGSNPAIGPIKAVGGDAGVIFDPMTGMAFDFKMLPIPNCDQVEIELSVFSDLYTIPNNVFIAPDLLNGLNGSFEWLIV